jgi:hypothetical protein
MSTLKLMNVRLQTHGPESWRLSLTDAETGRVIPILLDDTRRIELRDEGGVLVLRCDLMVSEIDIEAVMPVVKR